MPNAENVISESALSESRPTQPAADHPAKWVFLVLFLYFGAQLIARICISGALETDEAEQAILTQRWQWGYGPQGPLFTWLQIIVFKVFGVSVFGLSFLKNLLLLIVFAFTWLSARAVTQSNSRGSVAAALLMLIPEISWEFQRDLSHSVLVAALCAITLYIFVRLLQEGSLKHFLGLGVAAGLGALAKYNYGLFFISLLAAGFSIGLFRLKLVRPALVLTVLVAIATVTPHAIWFFHHKHMALGSLSKLGLAAARPWPFAVAKGGLDLARSVASQIAILVTLFALVRWRSRVPSFGENSRGVWVQLIIRQIMITLMICVLALIIFKVTAFKGRWIAPLVITSPTLLVLWLGERLTGIWQKRVIFTGLAMAAVVLALMPGHVYLAGLLDRPFNWNAPTDRLAWLCREEVARAGTVVAERALVGGNFRLEYPHKPVLVPDLSAVEIEPRLPILFVWNATESPEPPYRIFIYALRRMGRDVKREPVKFLEAPYKAHPERKMRLGLMVLETNSRSQ